MRQEPVNSDKVGRRLAWQSSRKARWARPVQFKKVELAGAPEEFRFSSKCNRKPLKSVQGGCLGVSCNSSSGRWEFGSRQ